MSAELQDTEQTDTVMSAELLDTEQTDTVMSAELQPTRYRTYRYSHVS